jgi:hypothetical protein
MPARFSLLVTALAVVATLSGCKRPAQPTSSRIKRAQFGIFFGEQVQEREQIPFELDRTRQMQGIRIDFTEPLSRPLKVTWEINRPLSRRTHAGSKPGTKAPGGDRVVELGEAEANAGQTRFDQLLPFKPGDPLGIWNLRVVVDQEVAIDRRVLIYDAAERARAKADAGAGERGAGEPP